MKIRASMVVSGIALGLVGVAAAAPPAGSGTSKAPPAGSGTSKGPPSARPVAPAASSSKAAPTKPPSTPAKSASSSAASPIKNGATCQDGDHKYSASFSASRANICVYWPDLKRLKVEIGNDPPSDFLIVQINGFKGFGTYKTTGAQNDEDTFVSVRGTVDKTDASDTGTGGAGTECPLRQCTITVSNAEVVTANPGRVVLDVACPVLGGAGVGCTSCTYASSFRVEVPACENAR